MNFFAPHFLAKKQKGEIFMMPNQNQPGLAQDLLRIHRVLTRALKVVVDRGEEFVQAGFPDAGMRKGFTDYTHSLAVVLDGHHVGEDEIAFPLLKEKIPAAPYDRLAKNHQEIVGLLDSLQPATAAVAAGSDESALTRLVDGVCQIYDIWRPHIQTEEHYFNPEALAEVMGPEEQGRASAGMAKHAQEHANPPFLAIPFVLYNLEPEDRAAMAAGMPPELVNELVPHAWKDQWAAMKPFLLE
jgi:hemerythrin-like domain-containing protein